MKPSAWKLAAIALVTTPFLLLTPACTEECVDQFDCAKPDAGGTYTCVSGRCQPGSPTPPPPDAGETGGGGGETGGGGGATGGGGGAMGGGGGSTGGGGGDDAGTGGGGGDDAGTGGGGGSTGGGGGSTGGGGGSTPVDPAGSYTAALSGAQVVPPDTTTDTGSGTFTVSGLADGGYSLQWNITHSFGAGGGTREGGLDWGIGGLAPTGTLQAITNIASPITGTLALTPAQAMEVAEGRLSARVTRGAATIRGQVVRTAHSLWTAQLNTSPASATRGGAQLIAPPDGGAVSYLGAWSGTVDATAAHIHQGGAGGMGPALITLSLTADAGGLEGSFPAADLSQAGNTDGGLYVNVHTTDAGDGLIRGQLVKH
jgi:hypothetical protein